MVWLLAILFILLLLVVLVVAIMASDIVLRMHFIRAEYADKLSLEVKALYGLFHYRFAIPNIDYNKLTEKAVQKASAKLKGSPAFGDSSLSHSPGRQTAQRITQLERQIQSQTQTDGKAAASKPKPMELYRDVRRNVRGLDEWMRETAKIVRCTEIRWSSHIGTGDAPNTAIVTGVGWAVKNTLLGFVFHYIRLSASPQIRVQPQYNQWRFETELSLQMNVRIFSVTLSGVRFLFRLKRLAYLRTLYRNLLSFRKSQAAAGTG